MRRAKYEFRAALVGSLVMQARISIAMHRIVEPFDVPASDEYRIRAHELAYSAGLNAALDARIPCLVQEEPVLLDGWEFGQTMAEESAARCVMVDADASPETGLPF